MVCVLCEIEFEFCEFEGEEYEGVRFCIYGSVVGGCYVCEE